MEVRTQHNSFRRVLRLLDRSRMPLLVLIVELELNRRRQGECDLWGELRAAPVEVSVAPPQLQRHRQDSGVANRHCADGGRVLRVSLPSHHILVQAECGAALVTALPARRVW